MDYLRDDFWYGVSTVRHNYKKEEPSLIPFEFKIRLPT